MRGNKKQIISIILAGAGLIGFVVAICFIFFGPRAIDDNYFINSDRRIVASLDNPSSRLMYGAKKLHKVYEVEDDKITSYKLYYVYENSGAASSKLQEAKDKSLEDSNIEKVEQNGKYIVVTMAKNMYEKANPDEMRANAERFNANQPRSAEEHPLDPIEHIEEEE